MFILMGQLVYRAELAGDLYDCLQKWMGWLPGGLAVCRICFDIYDAILAYFAMICHEEFSLL